MAVVQRAPQQVPWVVKEGTSIKAPIRIAIQGEPKTGKTRLSCGLPWGTPEFGEKALYVAWDPGSEELSSVLHRDKEHLVVIKPTPIEKAGRLTFDPHKTAFQIADRAWDKEYPEVKSLIWDTASTTAMDCLYAYANTGVFSGESRDKEDRHVAVGEPGDPWFMAQPMMGDYGLAQHAIVEVLKGLFKQPLNIIVLFHLEGTDGKKGPMIVGPATVGQAAISDVAGMFDNLVRTTVDSVPVPGTPPRQKHVHRLYTHRVGSYLGGLRTGHDENPIPVLDIPPGDPAAVWRKIISAHYGQEVK